MLPWLLKALSPSRPQLPGVTCHKKQLGGAFTPGLRILGTLIPWKPPVSYREVASWCSNDSPTLPRNPQGSPRFPKVPSVPPFDLAPFPERIPQVPVQARQLERDHPPTPNLKQKEHQHKSSFFTWPLYGSMFLKGLVKGCASEFTVTSHTTPMRFRSFQRAPCVQIISYRPLPSLNGL